MKRVGKCLAVISPVLAIAAAVSMLFGYSYETGGSAGSFSSGTVSAFRYALEQGDYAWFFWAGFMIVV